MSISGLNFDTFHRPVDGVDAAIVRRHTDVLVADAPGVVAGEKSRCSMPIPDDQTLMRPVVVVAWARSGPMDATAVAHQRLSGVRPNVLQVGARCGRVAPRLAGGPKLSPHCRKRP